MGRRAALQRARTLYRGAAVVLLNTLLLLTLLNGLAALSTTDRATQRDTEEERAWLIEAYGLAQLAKGYPGWDREELEAFLRETSRWHSEYEAFTQFRPEPRHDRWITITEEGFRRVPEQAPWPPTQQRFDVFVFGGSTTMGAGVPDDQTIPAHLSRRLETCGQPVGVYNFGRGYYFSSQERALLMKLLVEGRRPDLAVFVDGLNDFYYRDGLPQWTARLRELMDTGRSAESHARERRSRAILRSFALGRVLLQILPRGGASEGAGARSGADGTPPAPDELAARAVLARWSTNRRMVSAVGERFDVATAFVWQPVPTYGYDLAHHHLYDGDDTFFGGHQLSRRGYELMARRRRSRAMGANFLWLGDLQRGRKESLYVDAVHYDAAFSATIAGAIDRFLRSRSLVPCPAGPAAAGDG